MTDDSNDVPDLIDMYIPDADEYSYPPTDNEELNKLLDEIIGDDNDKS